MKKFLDDGSVTLTCDFPYSQVETEPESAEPMPDQMEPLLGIMQEIRDLIQDEREQQLRHFIRILNWVVRPGPKLNTDGMIDRLAIIARIYLPCYHHETETRVAQTWGKKKQSLDRAFGQLKKDFPQIAKQVPSFTKSSK